MNNRLTTDCHRVIASEIQALDYYARQLEQSWGAGRLRLLVDSNLRQRFDQQVEMLNTALASENATREEILAQLGGQTRAWQALEARALAAGHQPTPPTVWEIPMEGGKVALLVRDNADASQVTIQAKERACSVFTLEEIGRLLNLYPAIAKAKENFPGSVVTAVRPRTQLAVDLNDSIPF